MWSIQNTTITRLPSSAIEKCSPCCWEKHENPDDAYPLCSPLGPPLHSSRPSDTGFPISNTLNHPLGTFRPGLTSYLATEMGSSLVATVIPKNMYLAIISPIVASPISTQIMVPMLMMSELLLLASPH